MNSESWATKEFSGVNLGDKRLNKRFMKLADEFSKHPEFSINQASNDWHAAKAAYRFFQNDNFSESDLLIPHLKNSAERCKQYDYVLIAQDTSVIGFSHHPKTKGLGSIGGHSNPVDKVHGFYMHSALAMTTEGMPLGLLSNNMWSRTTVKGRENKIRTDHLIHTENKESYKWISSLEASVEALNAEVKAITICDRECDIFDFYLSAIDLQTDVIVRSKEDRAVGTRQMPINLKEKLNKTVPYHPRVIIKVPIEKEGNKDNSKATKYRDAELELKAIPVTLSPSRKQAQVVKERIDLYAVEAKEVNPPSGFEKAHWTLLTTIPIETFEEARLIVKYYSMRWKIENYFKILKSGCTIEKCRLGEGSRLKKYVMLFSVIAWRIFWMTFIKRVSPEASCEEALTTNEWKSLFNYYNRGIDLPEEAPSISEAFVWLARLGGFLARKSDGEPGPTYLWRGWSRLQDMAEMREIIS